ncbi:BTAD domain-containing putative transcriptional regulator [Streptomyces sp. NPDC050504]|uniref:BTAD domain-containing putative transcriptional regulator n=1 Tax=Streptomyces sp. NPDC050504 TaxID=3365618 RepID=UPI0037B220AE
MRFGVLGPLAVWDDDGEPVRVPEAKVRALLADLLVHEGRPVSVDRLVDDLWGGRPPGNPANALQAKVSQLRRAIGRDLVVHQPPGYRLRLGAAGGEVGGEVDADRFRALAERARREPDPRTRAALLTEALELWRGPAYADFADEEFVRTTAHRLAEQRLTVLEEQAEARLDAGEHTLLTGELSDLVARHPLRERLRAVQLRALYLAGRQSEALASYAELRDRLADELGLDPGPELAALHEAILRQDSALGVRHASTAPGGAPVAPSRPTPLSVRPHRSRLPLPLTSLVGREQTLRTLGSLLSAGRLVTLTGPGGVGKTRLALAAAAQAESAPSDTIAPDGVWLVELAGQYGGVDDLMESVSAALGLRDDTPAGTRSPGAAFALPSPAERVADALCDRRALLVLDNCEHVVEAAAALADRLLRAAPGLRVLATGRQPLGIAGEAVLPVEPLLPADAERMFAERAASAAPGFALDDAAARDAVAEIVRRLDGIPLALELAATRVRALGVGELAARIGDRFRVLASGQRGAPARQQTLRAVLDWSWELLSAPERIVLRRLAVHHDGCSLEAAEAVCAGEGVAADEVLDLVARLVDRSLVVVVPGRAGAAPRYRLLESVAAYAVERLHEMDDVAAVRDRHLRHYLDLAERAEPHLRSAGQREWLARLDADGANLRAALDAAPSGEAVRLATALSWWWLLRGRLHEAYRALSATLGAAPENTELRTLRDAFALLTGTRPEPVQPGSRPDSRQGSRPQDGRAAWLYAYALFSGGDRAAGEEANARVLARFEADGDRWGTAAALALRAMHALVTGDLGAIGRDGLRSAALFAELGDRWGESQTVTPLAVLAEIKGEYAEAERRHREGLAIARELGLETEVSARLSGLGRLALFAHDWQRARELHEEARLLAVEQGYKYGEVHSMMGLALGARRSGDLAGAQTHLSRIREGYADVSSDVGDHLLHAELGFVAELYGDREGAVEQHRKGLAIARTIGEPRALALSLEGLAGAAALRPETAGHAAELLGAAHAARLGAGAPLPPAERGDVDRIAAAATRALGGAAFEEAFARGAELAALDAVEHLTVRD